MAQKPPAQVRPFVASFWVNAPTKEDLVVFVTGNCPELGNWDPDHAFPLNIIPDGEVVIPYRDPLTGFGWSNETRISTKNSNEVSYHYFIGQRHPTLDGHALTIRRLEAHHTPRSYTPPTGDPEIDKADLFGVIDDEEISQIPGYLTDHSSISFVFDPAQIEWQAQNYHERQFRVRFEHAEPVRYNLRARPEYKVARYFREGNCHDFLRQSKHGPLVDSQPMIFRCDMHVFEICHIRVDFYEVGKDTDNDIPPLYFAYALIGGALLKGSHGKVTVPIRMPARHQVLRVTDCGTLTLRYTIAKALPRSQKAAKTTLFRPWQFHFKSDGPVLHMGHRGCGSNPINDVVRENTIESFNKASEAGADFVEFDVMFDADMIPIIYHDHTVLMRNKEGNLIEMAVKDIPVEILRSNLVYHVTETDGQHSFPKTKHDVPFPTLEYTLSAVNPDVGFNVEIKYPMDLVDGKCELNPTASSSFRESYRELRLPFWNKNHFVDGILHVLTHCSGHRPVMISSFDLDICIMARLKQIQFPVFLLTSNDVQKGLEYDDLRINYLKRAIYSAAAYELEGIVCPSACLFQHSWFIPLVKRLKLKVITYGEANNSVCAIQEVKTTNAVTGIIYDRIFDFVSCTKDHWAPKPPPQPCEPKDLGFIIGYTGFVPGRLDLVGTDSQRSSKSRCPPRTIEQTYPPVSANDLDPNVNVRVNYELKHTP